MVNVRSVVDSTGSWWVIVEISDHSSAKFGPYDKGEKDAFIAGAKSFASPHIVKFSA